MKNRFTEEQIIKAVTRVKNGAKPKDIGRELGVSEHTIYNWKKKYQNMTISEAKRLRELEAENSKLKRIVADQALDIVMLKDVNSRKW
jgi:putative transposase